MVMVCSLVFFSVMINGAQTTQNSSIYSCPNTHCSQERYSSTSLVKVPNLCI